RGDYTASFLHRAGRMDKGAESLKRDLRRSSAGASTRKSVHLDQGSRLPLSSQAGASGEVAGAASRMRRDRRAPGDRLPISGNRVAPFSSPVTGVFHVEHGRCWDSLFGCPSPHTNAKPAGLAKGLQSHATLMTLQ